jgi:hypothetical protein
MPRTGTRPWQKLAPLGISPEESPPNKALQRTGHSAFQSIHGTIWHRTQALRAARPAGRQLSANTLYGGSFVTILRVMVLLAIGAFAQASLANDTLKTGDIYLYQPDEVIKERLCCEDGIRFFKQVNEVLLITGRVFKFTDPGTGAIVVAVAPEKALKVWVVVDSGEFPETVRAAIKLSIQEKVPTVQGGPVAVAYRYSLAGAEIVKTALPIPEEWLTVIKESGKETLNTDEILQVLIGEPSQSVQTDD